MKIKIPNNNIAERKYIIDILLNEFLGLEYTLEIGSCDYEITLPNQKKLIIEDRFWNQYPNDLEYLHLENIPKSIKQLDIFSASFFMLTRWEEYVNRTRDKHGRFPATESLAYKEGFLDRPIVNEMLEELKAELFALGLNQKPKTKNYQLVLTHDIDRVYKCSSLVKIGREFLGDIFKRREPLYAIKTLLNNILSYLKLKKDPFDTYDYLMDMSEKVGVRSYFFLHSSSSSTFDVCNDESSLVNIVKKIQKRGHPIGYHPSYDAYNNRELFIQDKKKIERVTGSKLTFGRQHYLRFEIPTTWQIWEDTGMEWDSTLGYADKEGFRCGVCYPFSVFNILTRKKLRLQERPLIVMEGSFVDYQDDITPDKMEMKINDLLQKVKKYNGEFVFLWHNSSFSGNWKEFEHVYERVLLK